MDSEKRLVGGTIGYVSVTVLTLLLSFASGVFFNRNMTNEELGMYYDISSIIGIVSVIVTLSLESSIANAKVDFEGKKFDSYSASIGIFGGAVCICFIMVFELICFGFHVCNIGGVDIQYYHVACAFVFFSSPLAILTTKYKANMDYLKAILTSSCVTIFQTILSIAGVLAFVDTFSGRYFGYCLPTIIGGAIAIPILLRGKEKVKKEHIKYGLSISVPTVFHLLSGKILSVFDKIMISDICGMSQNANYSVAVATTSICTILWTGMNSAFTPWLFNRMKGGEVKKIRQVSLGYYVAYCTCVLLFTLIAPEFLLLYAGVKYSSSLSIITPQIMSAVIIATYTFYVNVEQYYKKQIMITISTFLAGTLNVFLNALFIPRMGYEIASITTLISYGFLLLIHFGNVVMVIKKAKQYNNFAMVGVMIISLAAVYLIEKIYNYRKARFIIFGVLVLGLSIAICYFLRRKNEKRVKNW